MADISITQQHTLPHDQARVAAQKVADQMASEYDLSIAWEGDILTFKRSGIDGTLAVQPGQAVLDITLSFMLKGFAALIEEKMSRNMAQVFVA
ncbi:MAG: polyhydroxyalkanoic acid system protein [Glaciimonas sp.]|nr:polyhydroxyalkanoic acid system protein [Glaciimonas sp.]